MKRFLFLSLLLSLLSCSCIGYNSFVLYKGKIAANGPRGVSAQETAFALDYPLIDSMTDSQKTAFALGYPAYMTNPQKTAFALGYPARTTDSQETPSASGYPARTTDSQETPSASGYPPSNPQNPQQPPSDHSPSDHSPSNPQNPQQPPSDHSPSDHSPSNPQNPQPPSNPQNPHLPFGIGRILKPISTIISKLPFTSGYNPQNPAGAEDLVFAGGYPGKLSNTNLCSNNIFSDEFLILIGTDPAPGQTIGPDGKLRVWVTDEGAPKIAPGEKVDPNTGQITPGDRTATDGRGIGFYLWEPALYITTVTSANQKGPFKGNAEDGGKPYFPSLIKGDYNPNADTGVYYGHQYHGPPIDDYTKFENGPSFQQTDNSNFAWSHAFTAEYIWDVNSLKLPHGVYHVEIITHDGDVNLSVDCLALKL